MLKDYIVILLGTLQRIHRQYVRYESALDNTLIEIEHLNSGYLTHHILEPRMLARYLEAVEDDLEETAPAFEPVFMNVYQYYSNSLISFTNIIDDLLLQLPILIKLKVQVPMSLFSIETAPVPLDAETYLGEKREYTQIIPETELIALTENNYIPLTQAQISLCAKIGYMYYCEYAHLLKKRTEHTCMSAIYYDQGSDIKVKQCKTIVTFDIDTIPAMLAAFLQTNIKNSAIQSVQADQIGRTYPPLFTINLPKEKEIIDDLREITTMEYVVQIIMIIVCITIVLIIMYFCCTKCRHTHTIFKYCFPFLPILCIVHMLRRTNLFVEVTNITKGNGVWAHFVSTGCFPTQIQLSRPIQKDDVQIETVCCIFKWIRIDWSSIIVTGISGTVINMPDTAFVSIFTDNDLTHITDDHFEIKLIARLLDQMYVIPPPVFPPRYDDAPPSAPQFPEHLHSLLTHS